MSAPTVAVFGGTGFLGRNIVAHLRTKGLAVRVVARHPTRAERVFGEPRPELSYQTGDLLDERSTAAAIEGAYMVVNAASLYAERDGITFEAVHVKGARRVARLSARHGAKRFVQISGIGADTRSRSRYIRTRGEGELAVRNEFSGAVVVRPAVMCGPGDAFLTKIIHLLRILPVFPLFGDGRTRLEPVFVGDVAEAVALLAERSAPLPTYEFGGGHVYTYRELIEAIARALPLRRYLLPVPFPVWKAMAIAAQSLPGQGLALNQVELMEQDNVATGTGNLQKLGVVPTPIADLVTALASLPASETAGSRT
jgi:NADH dehydrogenase